jgi:hypothetical protein
VGGSTGSRRGRMLGRLEWVLGRVGMVGAFEFVDAGLKYGVFGLKAAQEVVSLLLFALSFPSD